MSVTGIKCEKQGGKENKRLEGKRDSRVIWRE
jgi:hypothetical protein